MIIVDTNVVSEPLRPRPSTAVVEWLDAQAVETLYLTAITVAELRFGVAALPAGRRRSILQERLDETILPIFAERILSFTLATSSYYGILRAQARRAGVAIGDMDALIAAMAVEHGFAVATRDRTPFEGVGVSVIDPFSL